MPSNIRIIQYGLGPIGAAIARLIAGKANAQIVGAIDIDKEKVGKDVGEVIGLDRNLGVVVSDRADVVLSQKADVVVHSTSSYLTSVTDQLMACARAGSNIVSTCEELAYPLRKYPDLSKQLDEEARANGVTILGTGVNPGFVMDKLVLTLSTVCQQVETVFVNRVVNASKRRLPLQKKIGAGMTEVEFRNAVSEGIIKHHGLPESTALIAEGMGIPVDEITEAIDPVVAEEDVQTEYLFVKKGLVAGVKQVCHGTHRGQEKITLDLRMYVGAKEAADRISIKGVPDLELVIPGGTHGDLATAAVVVNSIPLAAEARPGLLTVKDIPVKYFETY